MIQAAEGAEYRADLTIYHYRRGARRNPFDYTNADAADRSRRYILRNASPGRVKITADFDATSADVGLAEVDCEYEWFEVEVDTGAEDSVLLGPTEVNLARNTR